MRRYMKKRDSQTKTAPAQQAMSQEIGANSGVPMDTMRSMLMNRAMADRSHRIDLPEAMRTKMEQSFGMNFGGVRLYESESVADAGANAIAQGGSIAFAPGKADFNTRDGRERLGHEFSHIAAQARGQVTGSGFLDNSALESRADREGAMAAAGEQVYDGPMMEAPSFSAAAPMQADGDGKKHTPEDYIQKLIAIKKAKESRKNLGGVLNFMNDKNAQDKRREKIGKKTEPLDAYDSSVFRSARIVAKGYGGAREDGKYVAPTVSDEDLQWYDEMLRNPSQSFMKKLRDTSDQYNKSLEDEFYEKAPISKIGANSRFEDEATLRRAAQSDRLNDAHILQSILGEYDWENKENEQYNQWREDYQEGQSARDEAYRENVKQWSNAVYDYTAIRKMGTHDKSFNDDVLAAGRKILDIDRQESNYKAYKANKTSVKELSLDALKASESQERERRQQEKDEFQNYLRQQLLDDGYEDYEEENYDEEFDEEQGEPEAHDVSPVQQHNLPPQQDNLPPQQHNLPPQQDNLPPQQEIPSLKGRRRNALAGSSLSTLQKFQSNNGIPRPEKGKAIDEERKLAPEAQQNIDMEKAIQALRDKGSQVTAGEIIRLRKRFQNIPSAVIKELKAARAMRKEKEKQQK